MDAKEKADRQQLITAIETIAKEHGGGVAVECLIGALTNVQRASTVSRAEYQGTGFKIVIKTPKPGN